MRADKPKIRTDHLKALSAQAIRPRLTEGQLTALLLIAFFALLLIAGGMELQSYRAMGVMI